MTDGFSQLGFQSAVVEYQKKLELVVADNSRKDEIIETQDKIIKILESQVEDLNKIIQLHQQRDAKQAMIDALFAPKG